MALEPVLELALVDQAGLELTEILSLCFLCAGIKGVHHHRLAYVCTAQLTIWKS